MQYDPLKQREIKVDTKTAEEALALALRLQEERGEDVSIDQLNKTADEAGIEREYLEEALNRIRAEKSPAQADVELRQSRLGLIFAITVAVGMIGAVLTSAGPRYVSITPLVAMLAAFACVLFVRRQRGGRR